MADVKSRPNIRVEIQNNLVDDEPMDVDNKSEEEEGEINEDAEEMPLETAPQPRRVNKIWMSQNVKDTFTTGINIFDKQEQEKRTERAKRFALKPEEIQNFTDDDLQQLYDSLGITSENENDVRFDTIHMLGVNDMSSEDILNYFTKYAPANVEWVDNETCNVVWIENITAARALYFNSKVVRGMPVRAPCDPFAREFLDLVEPETPEDGTSILLKNREVELRTSNVNKNVQREVELLEDEDDRSNNANLPNSVDVSEISRPIPPGYWRLCVDHSKSNCILLRFALKTDKQPYKIENFNKYYKKLGLKGAEHKQKLRGIFERNKDLKSTEKDPWGVLAQNWDEDAKFRERERLKDSYFEPKTKNPILNVRLGRKKVVPDVEPEEASDSESVKEKKKIKIPRMRMYADEEEEKIKRKKILNSIKRQTDKISREEVDNSDLRSILGLTNFVTRADREEEAPEVDLGTHLRNRKQKLIFTVERDVGEIVDDDIGHVQRENPRIRLERERFRSRSISPIRYNRNSRSDKPFAYGRMHADREESQSREELFSRKKGVIEKLHSDRESARDRLYRRRRDERERDYRSRDRPRMHSDRLQYQEDDHYSTSRLNKPKSKVAVVIKKQTIPSVASRIGTGKSRYNQKSSESDESESESESESSSSSSSSTASSESGSEDENLSAVVKVEDDKPSRIDRPGFGTKSIKERLSKKPEHYPLKIEISNDHFKRT